MFGSTASFLIFTWLPVSWLRIYCVCLSISAETTKTMTVVTKIAKKEKQMQTLILLFTLFALLSFYLYLYLDLFLLFFVPFKFNLFFLLPVGFNYLSSCSCYYSWLSWSSWSYWSVSELFICGSWLLEPSLSFYYIAYG